MKELLKELETLGYTLKRGSDLAKKDDEELVKLIVKTYALSGQQTVSLAPTSMQYFHDIVPGVFDGKTEIIACYYQHEDPIAAVVIEKTDSLKEIYVVHDRAKVCSEDLELKLFEIGLKWLKQEDE